MDTNGHYAFGNQPDFKSAFTAPSYQQLVEAWLDKDNYDIKYENLDHRLISCEMFNLEELVKCIARLRIQKKNNPFVEECRRFIDNASVTPEGAVAALNKLSEAADKLELVIEQAEAQFKVGDEYATFTKAFIKKLKQK